MRKFLYPYGQASVEVDKYGLKIYDGHEGGIYIDTDPWNEKARKEQLKAFNILREAIDIAENFCKNKKIEKEEIKCNS